MRDSHEKENKQYQPGHINQPDKSLSAESANNYFYRDKSADGHNTPPGAIYK
jgi:hypothetical protein